MVGKMLARMNQLRESYTETYNDPKYKEGYPLSKYSPTRVPYYDNNGNAYYVIFKTKEDRDLQSKIIESLNSQIKERLIYSQLENALDRFLSPYVVKKQGIKKEELRNWKNEILSLVQQKITFYYPIENFNLDQDVFNLSEDAILYKSDSLINKWNISKTTPFQDGYVDYDDVYKYLSMTQTILAIRVLGIHNYISINQASEKAKLTVDLINFLNKTNNAKCTLLNNIYQHSPENNVYYHGFCLYSLDNDEPRYDISLANLPVCQLDSNAAKYSFIFNPQDIQVYLTNGIKWLGESILEEDIKMKFIKCMFALESVTEIDPNGSSVSLVEQVSTFVSILLEKDPQKRIELKKRVKLEYNKRSRIVHGENCKVTVDDYDFIYGISEKIINMILDLPKFKKFKSIKEIWQDMQNKIMEVDY